MNSHHLLTLLFQIHILYMFHVIVFQLFFYAVTVNDNCIFKYSKRMQNQHKCVMKVVHSVLQV